MNGTSTLSNDYVVIFVNEENEILGTSLVCAK